MLSEGLKVAHVDTINHEKRYFRNLGDKQATQKIVPSWVVYLVTDASVSWPPSFC